MTKRLLSLLIAAFLVISNINYSYAESKYTLNNQKEFSYVQNIAYKNTGKGSYYYLKVNLFVGNDNFTAYQKSTKTIITPEPQEIIKDQFGNQIAKIVIKKWKPGETINFRIEKQFTVSSIKYNISYIYPDAYITTELSKYLKPQDKIESNNIKMINQAKELTKDLKNNYEKAKNIFEFTNKHIKYDKDIRYANKGALSGLENKMGVCEDYADLFVALCRASNIPARVVTGNALVDVPVDSMVKNDWYNVKGYRHAWAEFYLNGYGWVPVEVTFKSFTGVYWQGFGALDSNGYIVESCYSDIMKGYVLTSEGGFYIWFKPNLESLGTKYGLKRM